MKSMLPPQAYFCEDWFAKEQEKLIKPLWQFVAPRALLCKPNSFVRRRIAGVDVVVQNFDGQLKAFQNICLHRLSPIQNEDHGIRPLVCPYHAWRYDAEGRVEGGIPFPDACSRLAAKERSGLHWKQFALHEFGSLIFINLSDKPIAFEEQFSIDALQSLKAASEIFDDEILVTQFDCKFNWKLIYENLRDSLHPRFVHPTTVYRTVKFEARINEQELIAAKQYVTEGVHSREAHLRKLREFSGGGLNEPMPNLPHYHWHDYVERHGTDDWYLNWLLYPNLHIASGSGGYSFIIEHHIPVSATRTNFVMYYVTGRKKRRYPTSAAVLMAHLEGAEKVLREDIDIMEKVQSSFCDASPTPTTGDFEYSNMAIERWYLDVLEGRHAL